MRIKVSGVSQVRRILENYKKALESKKRLFMEKLAQIGIDTATARYEEAVYDGDFDIAVSQSPVWDGDRLIVQATGDSILFVEFGTGVYYTDQHPLAGEFGFERGKYGSGHGSQRTWGYYGTAGQHGTGREIETNNGTVTLTHGNPPARAMYEAEKQMRESIRAIAKEVFGT